MKLQKWMIGGIIGVIALIVLAIIVFIMDSVSPGMGSQLWAFFGKIYLTSSLGSPALDIITMVVRWGLIGAIIGLFFDLL